MWDASLNYVLLSRQKKCLALHHRAFLKGVPLNHPDLNRIFHDKSTSYWGMLHLWTPPIYQCLCHPILWKSDAGTTARVAPDPMQLLPIDSWLVGLYEVVYWAGHCIPMIFSFLLLILQFLFLSLIVVIMSYSDFQSVYYIYIYIHIHIDIIVAIVIICPPPTSVTHCEGG